MRSKTTAENRTPRLPGRWNPSRRHREARRQNRQRTVGTGFLTQTEVHAAGFHRPALAEEVSRACATVCQHPVRCQGTKIQGVRIRTATPGGASTDEVTLKVATGAMFLRSPGYESPSASGPVCRSSRKASPPERSETKSKRCVLDFLAVDSGCPDEPERLGEGEWIAREPETFTHAHVRMPLIRRAHRVELDQAQHWISSSGLTTDVRMPHIDLSLQAQISKKTITS